MISDSFDRLLLGLMLLLAIGLVFSIVYLLHTYSAQEMYYGNLDCYDNHGNVIKELKCEKKIYCGGFLSFLDSKECDELSWGGG